MTSNRPRVRPYSCTSRLMFRLPSYWLMFFVYVPTWSMSPVIVTFGAGACARAGGARTPGTATRATARINRLLITTSSKRGELQERTAVVHLGRQPQHKQPKDCGA